MAARPLLLVATLAASFALTATSAPGDAAVRADSTTVLTAARAESRATRQPVPVVHYEVFGDSITSGLGLPAHLTWVTDISQRLTAGERGLVEHRFRNHAVDGQTIVTPSPIAVDPTRSTLLDGIRSFLDDPPGTTPLARRRYVITPSVNELILSDQGPSSAARVTRAVNATRLAAQLLLWSGVPTGNIIVLPMPPIGRQFADAHDADPDVDVDAPLPEMITAVNVGLTGLLTLGRYPMLDPEDDGLADPSVFDDWAGPDGRQPPDGLHLDVDGHALLASDIALLFGTQ